MLALYTFFLKVAQSLRKVSERVERFIRHVLVAIVWSTTVWPGVAQTVARKRKPGRPRPLDHTGKQALLRWPA